MTPQEEAERLSNIFSEYSGEVLKEKINRLIDQKIEDLPSSRVVDKEINDDPSKKEYWEQVRKNF